MRKLSVIAIALTLIAALALPTLAPARAQDAQPDIVDIAVADGRFTTLVAAVTAAGLVDTLKSDGPFTVFAPTDAAFAALPAGTVDALLADPNLLTDVLLYHVVPGEVYAADVVGLSSAQTAQGASINIGAGPTGVSLNGSANVIITDIQASNGVIHVIDAVIFPPDNIVGIASKNWFLSTLVTALDEANLVGALLGDGPFTVFAPTNDAFAAALNALGITAEELFANKALLTSVLLYHVVPGAVTADQVVNLSSATTLNGASISIQAGAGGVGLNNGQANVILTDLIGSNGVIHVIDGVLLPPQ
jgi:transforming growth factor-beta-induced protein